MHNTLEQIGMLRMISCHRLYLLIILTHYSIQSPNILENTVLIIYIYTFILPLYLIKMDENLPLFIFHLEMDLLAFLILIISYRFFARDIQFFLIQILCGRHTKNSMPFYLHCHTIIMWCSRLILILITFSFCTCLYLQVIYSHKYMLECCLRDQSTKFYVCYKNFSKLCKNL